MGNLPIVALKTEYPIMFCTDVQGIAIDSKGGSCVWHFWSDLLPRVYLGIYLIDTAATHTVKG